MGEYTRYIIKNHTYQISFGCMGQTAGTEACSVVYFDKVVAKIIQLQLKVQCTASGKMFCTKYLFRVDTSLSVLVFSRSLGTTTQEGASD